MNAPSRLTYDGLLQAARSAGLTVTGDGFGRYEIKAAANSVVVYLRRSSWAMRGSDAMMHHPPKLRLSAAYAYLGLTA